MRVRHTVRPNTQTRGRIGSSHVRPVKPRPVCWPVEVYLMPSPNLPPEWVQQALRTEVETAFGAGAALTFTEGRAAVVITAGAGRFTMPMMQSVFGDEIRTGDELEIELAWQPVDGPERAAQQEAYGSVLDFEAFAAQTEPLYWAWRFVVSHFPFGRLALQSARWDKNGMTIEVESHALVFPRTDWFGETRPASAQRQEPGLACGGLRAAVRRATGRRATGRRVLERSERRARPDVEAARALPDDGRRDGRRHRAHERRWASPPPWPAEARARRAPPPCARKLRNPGCQRGGALRVVLKKSQ